MRGDGPKVGVISGLSEVHDQLGAQLRTDRGSDNHGYRQSHIDVADLAVTNGRDYRLAAHVGQVSPDSVRHRKAENVEGRGDNPGSTDSEKPPQTPTVVPINKSRSTLSSMPAIGRYTLRKSMFATVLSRAVYSW